MNDKQSKALENLERKIQAEKFEPLNDEEQRKFLAKVHNAKDVLRVEDQFVSEFHEQMDKLQEQYRLPLKLYLRLFDEALDEVY